jgi:hypothetical protein
MLLVSSNPLPAAVCGFMHTVFNLCRRTHGKYRWCPYSICLGHGFNNIRNQISSFQITMAVRLFVTLYVVVVVTFFKKKIVSSEDTLYTGTCLD